MPRLVGALVLLTVLAIVAMVLGAPSGRASQGVPTVGAPRLGTHGTVSHLILPSGDKGSPTRAVWLYRPPVPDQARLPVVYYLHGFPGGADDLGHAGIATMLDRRFAAGDAPFLLVAPEGNDGAGSDTEWADAANGSIELESFLVHILIPAVEGRHHRSAQDRALVGLSMGGYGAMNIGLHHPERFGQVASIAGYYVVDDPDGLGASERRWELRNDPSRHVRTAKGRRFLLVHPDQEDQQLMEGEDDRFAPLLRAAGASTVEVRERPGRHDLAFAMAELPSVFDFLAQGWAH